MPKMMITSLMNNINADVGNLPEWGNLDLDEIEIHGLMQEYEAVRKYVESTEEFLNEIGINEIRIEEKSYAVHLTFDPTESLHFNRRNNRITGKVTLILGYDEKRKTEYEDEKKPELVIDYRNGHFLDVYDSRESDLAFKRIFKVPQTNGINVNSSLFPVLSGTAL